MSYKNRCLAMAPDIARLIQDGYIGVCRLVEEGMQNRGSKAPERSFKEKDWLTVEDIESTPDRNMGICFMPEDKQKDKILCCIDVDGQDKTNPDIAQGSIIFLKNILLESLKKRGINPVVIKTKSNGFHIYLWATKTHTQKHGFKDYVYPLPSVFAIANRPEFQEFPRLRDILGQRCRNGIYEMFSSTGMTVAPGSIIEGKAYKLLDEGNKSFYDIKVHNGYFEDLIFEIIEENFFKYDPVQQKSPVIIEQSHDTHNLTPRNIQKIGDLIIETWPLIEGEKQAATLALGGFLYSRNVSQQSIVDIGNYVIDNKPDPHFFKGSDEFERTGGFMTALLHDSKEHVEKQKQGLTTLSERFRGKYDIQKLQKVLWLNAAPTFHQFYPKGREVDLFPRITLDFSKKEIRYDILRRKMVKTKEDGQEIEEPKEFLQPGNEIIHHMISDFTYINDISDPRTLSDIEKPVQFTIETVNRPPHQYVLDNRATLFSKYHLYEGAYTAKGKNIIEYMFMEYELLNLIPTEEGSSRPGIYLSKDRSTIRRYIDTEEGVKERPAFEPDYNDLANALQLLTEINSAMPWKGNKFASVVKLALLQPYSFLYKTFNKWVPGIILYGEAGALKSTVGDMLCQLSTPINVNNEHYITSGTEINSEFRMGRDFAYNSYPLVMNECLDVFSSQGNVETLKNIIDQQVIRSPGGDDGETYYARSVPIITLNDELEAMSTREFARRFLSINLTPNDAYTQEQIDLNMAFLNKDFVQNKRFEELLPIGDFVFNFLSTHMDLFSYNIYKAMDSIVEALQSATNVDMSWLDVDVREHIDIEIDESVNTELDTGLKALRRIFLENRKPFLKESEEELLRNMIGREYGYILFTKQNDVMITRGFEKEFDHSTDKKVKLLRFAELLNQYYDSSINYTDTQTADIQGSTSENRKQRRGIILSWDTFLEVMHINKKTDTEIITDMIKDDL